MSRLKAVMSSWSSQDPESRNSFLLVAGISAIIVVALIIIGFGYYTERVAAKNDPVLRVGNRDISYAELDTRLKYELAGVTNLTQEQFPALVSSVMISMENEELVRQAAKERGITLTDEDVEAAIRDEIGIAADAPRELYASRLRRELLNNGLSLEEYTRLAESLAIEDKMRELLGQQVPSEAEQVDIRIMQLTDREAMDAAHQRLKDGEPLSALAATLSIHPSRDSAGQMGWVPRGAFPAEVEAFAFSAENGSFSDVIETPQDGFYIVELHDRQVRAVDDKGKDAVVTYQLIGEIRATKERIGSEFLLNNGQLNDLTISISNFLYGG